MAILVTGATGIVGCELVAALLAMPSRPRIHAVVRGDGAMVAEKERWLRAWVGNPPEDRLVVEAGDCEVEGFALSSKARARIESDVTSVLHAAASTEFDMSADQAFAANVLSTRHAVALARRLPRLERFGFVSSAYIAGARSGVILEDAARLDARFDNEYQRSKALAETEVLASGLPAVSYRLGIVVGRAADGVTSRTTGAPYLLMRLVHEGLMALYPSGDGQTVDMLPVDFAADAVAHLFCTPRPTRPILHVCAGRDGAITTSEFFVGLVDALGTIDPQWRAQGLPMPTGAPLEALRAFRKTVDLVANPRLKAIARRVDRCIRAVELPKVFDTEAFTASLQGSGLSRPSFRSYFPRVVAHAAANGFRPTRRPWDPA
jgi:nucleoside-diphosphate-sugar epimerase